MYLNVHIASPLTPLDMRQTMPSMKDLSHSETCASGLEIYPPWPCDCGAKDPVMAAVQRAPVDTAPVPDVETLGLAASLSSVSARAFPFTEEQIKKEAMRLYLDYASAVTGAGGTWPPSNETPEESPSIAKGWFAVARSSLVRKRAAVLDMRDRCAAWCDYETATRAALGETPPTLAAPFVGYAAKHIRELDA